MLTDGTALDRHQHPNIKYCNHNEVCLTTPLIDPRVIEWLEVFARERSLEWRRDATGNCCIARPGSAGGEKAPPVVIQGKAEVL